MLDHVISWPRFLKDMVDHVHSWFMSNKGHGLPCCSMVHHVISCFNLYILLPVFVIEFRLFVTATMVWLRSTLFFEHGWHSSFSESARPWLTMVSLVLSNVHGWPWSNHGQTMDKPGFIMVGNHEKPCSKHGWPWSNRGPGAGVCLITFECIRLCSAGKKHVHMVQ